MERVKFYDNEYTIFMSDVNNININIKIKDNSINSNWNINDCIEYYNIIKFLKSNNNKLNDLKNKINLTEIISKINNKISLFFNQNKIFELFKDIDSIYISDFFEIINNYSIYRKIDRNNFNEFLSANKINPRNIIPYKNIVNKFKREIKEFLLKSPKNIEFIIDNYIDNKGKTLHTVLDEEDINGLIKDYIQLDNPNINTLQNILYIKDDILKIPEETKFLVSKRIETKRKEIYKTGLLLKSSIGIEYTDNFSDLEYPIRLKEKK